MISNKLTQTQVKNSALVAAGIPGSKFGHMKASQVHKDKRRAQRNGDTKHKQKLCW